MSNQPPDKIAAAMVPNPDDGKSRRSRAEEERRQKAVLAIAKLEAERAGLSVAATPGQLDPTAKPNIEREERIKKITTPKLLETDVKWGAKVHYAKSRTTKLDGTVVEEEFFTAREANSVKLGASLQELADLGQKLADIVGDAKNAVIEFAGKVGAWIGAAIAKGVGSRTQDK